ncbi:Uncharacterised protein [uncultured archaeon]|nr:Uncharacterised protein [uncultured archaeon]
MELWKRRTHKIVSREHSHVLMLKNGQCLATIPRELTRWKKIGKGTLLKWSDAGSNRLLIEVVQE